MRKLLLTTVLLVVFSMVVMSGIAQDEAEECPVLDENALGVVVEACEGLVVGQVCDISGDFVDLADYETLSTDDGNIIIMQMAAGLPDDAENAVTMVLFGGAELTNTVIIPEGPPVTLDIRNVAGYTINLRSGPSTDNPEAGSMNNNAAAIADGRNEAGDWIRIQSEEGHKWVHWTLIYADGDIDTLQVTSSKYTLPMQSFNLITGNTLGDGCQSGGLLVRLSGEDTARIQINGIDISFTDATFLVKAATNEKTQIMVLAGLINAESEAVDLDAPAGSLVEAAIGGDDGLSVIDRPHLIDSFSFAATSNAPLAVLPGDSICLAGVNEGDDLMTIRTGPGDEFATLFDLDAAEHYNIAGQTGDWWELDIPGYNQAWIPQDAVLTAGRCSEIEVVEAPAIRTTTSNGSDGGMSLLPDAQSVWMADSGPDVMTGTCNGNPIALCNHLVAINPVGGGQITWRGQEPVPYTLAQVSTNVYAFNGRSVLGSANVSFTLTLTSESTWELALTTVYDDDPQCNHTFYYNAVRNW